MFDPEVAAVRSLLEDLQFFSKNCSQGATRNFLELKAQFQYLEAVMTDYPKYKSIEHLESFINENRAIVYEAAEIIDSYWVKAAVQKSEPLTKIYELITKIFEVNYQIHAIAWNKLIVPTIGSAHPNEEQIERLIDTLGSMIIRPAEVERQTINSRPQMAPFIAEDYIVDRDDAATELIDLLTVNSNHLEIVTIVGTIGLGKTTLAKRIFNDPRIESEFPVRAFVCVSEEYDLREILISILSCFNPVSHEMTMMGEEKLTDHVCEQLECNKYLVVMDDVREREDWDRLKLVVSNNKMGSRILITTRKTYVAAHANPCVKPHYLRILTGTETRELLEMKVFEGGRVLPPAIEECVTKILGCCFGLPLAITLVAGFLQSHRWTIDRWKSVVDSLTGFDPQDEHQILRLINWSYDHLAEYLRPCFLYLGVFPKGLEIPVSHVLELWIAEGFIPQKDGVLLEEVAEDFLQQLVSWNLVVVGKRSLDGRIKTCLLYESMTDFCKQKALEEKLFQEIDEGKTALPPSNQFAHHLDSLKPSPFPINRFSHHPPRICINPTELDRTSRTPGREIVRSLLTIRKKPRILVEEHITSICKYKLLRVLDAWTHWVPYFPSELCRLTLLKYMAIRGNFSIIPSELSLLVNLQTLIVESKRGVFEIRANILKMKQLRHLHTNTPAILRIPGRKTRKADLQTLKADLQTLSIITPGSCRENVFKSTPLLKKLGIHGDLALLVENRSKSGCLCQLEHLQKLKLLNSAGASRLEGFLDHLIFPSQIRKLTLMNTSMPWNKMSMLGKLDKLEVLKLKDNAFVGDNWQTEAGGFNRLEVLHIGKTNLQLWEASADHFPKLRCLLLRSCCALGGIPESMADIRGLQFISLHHTNSQLATTAKKIQELKHQRGSGMIKLTIVPIEN